jgi:hypothetical protein
MEVVQSFESKNGGKATLEAKALRLTGGPASEKAPAGCNQYAWGMEGRLACSSPAPMRCWRRSNKDAPPLTLELARIITGADGEAILAKYRFGCDGSAK